MTAPSQVRPAGSPAARARLPMTPGRRLALSLGLPVLLVFIGWLALNVVALCGQASFPVRFPIPVTDGQVTARLNSAGVTLRQAAATGQGGTAELTGTAHYSLFRPAIRISGSTVTFPCRLPFGDCSLNATLQVPAQTAVSLSTYGGDAAIPGFAGSRLTVLTDGGDLTAGHLAGHLDLETGGGDVTAASADGGPVVVNTDGGELRVNAMRAPAASVRSGGGDVWLVCATAPDSLQISSDGGNVTLVVPKAQYRVNLDTDGGSESNAAGDNTSAAKSITVDSGGGNITIREAS